MHHDAVVIGGGFYGCSIARHLADGGARRVLLIEADRALMTRASYANQARVHQGYHYPRSLLTAFRCRVNFARFVAQYRDAIVDSFDMYYAVARRQSNVTADQFVRFCRRIGAPIEAASGWMAAMFDDDLVEGVFRVSEPAFDADRLRARVEDELRASAVSVRLGARAIAVRPLDGALAIQEADGSEHLAERVFNCTYSSLNDLLAHSGLETIALKHEITELALVRVPLRLARSSRDRIVRAPVRKRGDPPRRRVIRNRQTLRLQGPGRQN